MHKGTAVGVVGVLALTACGGDAEASGDPIVARGSATVAPITEPVAADGGFDVEVNAEGTTNGFEAFCSGDVDINNASEAIPGPDAETDFLSQCEQNGVEFIELAIGLDSLTVVRNQANDFAGGEAGEIRDDYQKTDDLDQLATWIYEDENAVGFMGIGNYYTAADDEVRDQLSSVSIDGVAPTLENAQNGSYTPLTRPLFIYVNLESLEENEDLEEFVSYYVENAYEIMPRTFFYRLTEDDYESVRHRLETRTTGSLYEGDPFREEPVGELLD